MSIEKSSKFWFVVAMIALIVAAGSLLFIAYHMYVMSVESRKIIQNSNKMIENSNRMVENSNKVLSIMEQLEIDEIEDNQQQDWQEVSSLEEETSR